jgi:hypothetical protein
MRLMLAIKRRAAGLCLLLVMGACGEELPPAAPTPPSTPVAPTFTLSGVITERFSGRPVEGAKVWVWPFPSARVSWPPGGLQTTPSDGAGRYTISGLPPVGAVWVSTAQTWGGRLQRPVRASVRDDGDGRGQRDTGPDRLIYDGSRRAQRVHRSGVPKFANRIGHGFRNHRERPPADRKRLGRVGSGCRIGRRRRRDEN